MRKKYKFDSWHITSFYQKDYAADIVDKLNFLVLTSPDSIIVECGCGLGDLVGVMSIHKYGYDISKVICAARRVHHDVDFKVGSFDEITESKIDCFIMVNFINEIAPADLKRMITALVRRTDIHMIVFDRLFDIEGTHYKYSHSGREQLEGSGYVLKYQSRNYKGAEGAYRVVEFWE